MFVDYSAGSFFALSKEKLDDCLIELGKHFRKQYNKKAEAEIILIGGASVLINYDFRNASTDADAIIQANASMRDSINHVRDKFGLPHGWLNEDFKNTKSYTPKLRNIATHYRTFSNVLKVMTVKDEYLIAMKAMSGRRYKFDLSDIVGILWEHFKNGEPITRQMIDNAIALLYGKQEIPAVSKQLLDDAFASGNYEGIYNEVRVQEQRAKKQLLEFADKYPNAANEDNTNEILDAIMRQTGGVRSDNI